MATKQPKFSRKAPVRRREPGIGHVIPFFAVLAVLTVVSFIIPLRPTVSYIENLPYLIRLCKEFQGATP